MKKVNNLTQEEKDEIIFHSKSLTEMTGEELQFFYDVLNTYEPSKEILPDFIENYVKEEKEKPVKKERKTKKSRK